MKKCILFLLLSCSLAAQNKVSNKVLIPYRDKNLWGLSDTLGKVVVKPFAKEIKQFVISTNKKYNSRYVVKTNKSYFVIDQNKTVLLPETNVYDSIVVDNYYLNNFYVYKNGKAGVYTKGKQLIACQYDKITAEANDSYFVYKNELQGLINSQGKLIIPIEYTNIYQSWEDIKKPKFVWVAEGKSVDKKFYDIKIPGKNDRLMDIATKRLGDELIVDGIAIDEKIKKLKEQYDSVEFNSRLYNAIVEKGHKFGIYDFEADKETVAPLYEEIKPYAYDRGVLAYLVKLNGKFGMVKEGNIKVLDAEYDDISYDTKNRMHVLAKNNKKGIIVFNTIYPIIPAKYSDILSYRPIHIHDTWQFGLFTVVTENGTGYVGENGVEFFKD